MPYVIEILSESWLPFPLSLSLWNIEIKPNFYMVTSKSICILLRAGYSRLFCTHVHRSGEQCTHPWNTHGRWGPRSVSSSVYLIFRVWTSGWWALLLLLTSFQCLVHLCASAAHRCWWCTPSRTCNTRSFALVFLSHRLHALTSALLLLDESKHLWALRDRPDLDIFIGH